mgnify:CR=1 FL=1
MLFYCLTASPENGSAVDENAGNVIKVVSRLLHTPRTGMGAPDWTAEISH